MVEIPKSSKSFIWSSTMLGKGVTIANVSINVGGGGGGFRAYVGHLTFQKNVWLKSPPWGPKIWSNQIKYSHLGEVNICYWPAERSA